MKAAIYSGGGGPITIEDLPDPEPGPGEVVIKVHRCGICGTDLSMTKGAAWDYGRGQFGHEYAGEIVALGAGVDRHKLGDRIAVLPSGACGNCEGCRGGNHVLCRNAPGAAHGFAEYARVPGDLAITLPSTVSLADGALIEPLAVSRYGVKKSPLKAGDQVLVLGGGAVALTTIYWARRMGAGRIVAASRSARRKELCLAMGADAFVPFRANAGEEIGAVAEALGGSPEVVYECVGAEGMLAKAIGHAGLYGTVTSLGFCTHADPIMPALGAYKCVTLQFLAGYGLEDFRETADHLDAGHVDPATIVTSAVPLRHFPATMDLLHGPNAETKVHVLL